MNQNIFLAGSIVGSAAALAASLAWLAGLMLVLRGTKPQDRYDLLRAYTKCRPPLAWPVRMPQCAALSERVQTCRLASHGSQRRRRSSSDVTADRAGSAMRRDRAAVAAASCGCPGSARCCVAPLSRRTIHPGTGQAARGEQGA